MTVRIICADVMDGLRQLEDESVHCVVTSPPYWGLRDYGVAGQIGLEASLGEHIDRMVAVMSEVRRVLRKDGTLWFNYGDCYATSINGRSAADTKALGNDDRTFRDKPFSTVGPVWRAGNPDKNGGRSNRNGDAVASSDMLKPKDLCGVPWRIALALQADGWWLRSDIIWAKPNPMPESVTDRPTKAHEYIFMLTKSSKYYYDANAIREPYNENSLGRYKYALQGTAPTCRQIGGDVGRREREKGVHDPNPLGRNKRSVWEIATAPYSEAHFATFPPELPEICIKAGTSEKGCCAKCGAPWRRETEKVGERPSHSGSSKQSTLMLERRGAKSLETSVVADGMLNVYATTGWSASCSCNADTVPATVLDCFAGAGTTSLVADRLQRNAVGIELNPEYAAMAEKRIARDRLERGHHSMEEVAKAKLPPTPLEALMNGETHDAA